MVSGYLGNNESPELRIGVFVCDCGTNIAGVIKVPEVVEFAKTLDDVVISEEGSPVIIHQDRDITDVLSLIICLLTAINNALKQLQQCEVDARCTLVAVLTLIINILQCGRQNITLVFTAHCFFMEILYFTRRATKAIGTDGHIFISRKSGTTKPP